MGSKASKQLQFLIISLFAIGVFAIAGFIVLQANADPTTPLGYLRRNKNGTEEASKKIADAGLQEAELGLTPAATTDNQASLTSLESSATLTDSSADFPNLVDESTALPSTSSEPFYVNRHWLVLVGDAILIAILTVVLLIRLVTKLFSQPIDPSAQKPESKNSNKVLTIDQLDVDIPV